jgi:hypothetical protein
LRIKYGVYYVLYEGLGRKMNWPLWTTLLLLTGIPVNIIVFSLLREYPAHILIKRAGPIALGLYVAASAYLALIGDPLWNLIAWGAVAGLAGTAFLDIVRLSGVVMGMFPADMPRIFGSLALGTFFRFVPKNAMASMVALLSELHEETRRELMTPRITAFANLPDDDRRVIVALLVNGLNKLPEEKRNRVVKTMIEILAKLPDDRRAAMMRTMDRVMMATYPLVQEDPARSKGPRQIFRENKWIPRMPMWPLFYRVMSRGLSSAAEEAGIPYWHVVFAGYLWHYVVGATFGIAHMMLFGSANLATTIGWGIFIWAVMMTVMPPMMPMVKLPYPRFMVIPFIAHLAFSLPVWWVASSLITPAAHASSLLGALRSP